MPRTVFAAVLASVVLLLAPAGDLSASNRGIHGSTQTERAVPATVPPEDTINEFLPEERSLGECISALPKPGCGSEARGGWRQGIVFLAVVAGLALIAWRIVVSARRARRTPAATTVPDDGERSP